jgi:WD40 repeat protein
MRVPRTSCFLLPVSCLLFFSSSCAAPPLPRSSPALRIDRVLSRGALAYAVALTDDGAVVAVELETDVQLVVRRRGAAERRLRLGPAEHDVLDLAIAPRTHTAYVASTDGTVRTVDLDALRVTSTWHLGDAATSTAVSPDGAFLAAGGRTGLFCVRRLADGALLQCVAAHDAAVAALAFSPDGARLATASHDGRVAVWSLPALALLAELRLDAGASANDVAFAPDGALLAIATSRSPPVLRPTGPPPPAPAKLLLWRPVRGEPARALEGHTGPVTSVAWIGSGRRLLSASWDRSVRLWDVRRHRAIGQVAGFAHIVRDLAADGGRAAAAAWGPGDAAATVLLGIAHPP